MPLTWPETSDLTTVADERLPRVGVVLLNWNQWDITLECLESLLRQDYPRFTVVVCDNASTDGSVERLVAWSEGRQVAPLTQDTGLGHLSQPGIPKPIRASLITTVDAEAGRGARPDDQVVIIQARENLGFTGGNNLAMRYLAARGDVPVTWILNNDTVVAPDALRQLVTPLVNSRDVGATGATMFEYRTPNVVQAAAGGAFSPRQLFPALVGPREIAASSRPRIDFISGACVVARTSDLVEVAMLDETFYIYGEDVDLSLKIERSGRRLVYVPAAKIWHKGGGNQGYGNPKHDYYTTRNTLILIRRYYVAFLPYALMYALYRVIAPKIVRRQWVRFRAVVRSVSDFLSGTTGRISI